MVEDGRFEDKMLALGDETGAQAVETREIELDWINLLSGSNCDKLS